MSDYPKKRFNKARPGVQAEIDKFFELSEEEQLKSPLLYWLLGTGTPPYKMSKKDTEYTDQSKVQGQHCADCEFSYKKVVRKEPFFICSQIRGSIVPEGWCNRWEKGTE